MYLKFTATTSESSTTVCLLAAYALAGALLSFGLIYVSVPQVLDEDTKKTLRVRSNLALFLSKGQLALETYPSLGVILSLYIGPRLSPILIDAVVALLSSLAVAFLSKISAPHPHKTKISGYLRGFLPFVSCFIGAFLGVFTLQVYYRRQILETIVVEDALSDLTCFSALVLEELTFLGSVQSTSRQRVLSIGRAFGLVLLASLALNLGSDTSVVATFFFIVVVGVYESVFRKLSDLSISIYKVALQLISISLAIPTILLSVTILCYGTSLVAPKSETSFGGNYNLRYLSAYTRRELRAPFFPAPDTVSVVDRETSPTVPIATQSFLQPGSPVSLYVRGAGFLWTDDHLWNFTLRAFHLSEEEVMAEEYPQNTQRRVVFSDRLGRMVPWIFQRRVSTESDMKRDDIYAGIKDGEEIFIRDAQFGRFLTVDRGVLSIVDEIEASEGQEEETKRVFVSVHATPTEENSLWVIHYNQKKDAGFRIYNQRNGCFLVSTFRSFPDYHSGSEFISAGDGTYRTRLLQSSHVNDTFSHLLQLEIEVACYESPTSVSSTFFVVDGAPAPEAKEPSVGRGKVFSNIADRLRWTQGIISSQLFMRGFRHLHHELQDIPLHVVQSSLIRSLCLPYSIAYLYLLAFVLAQATRKRTSCSTPKVTRFISRTVALVVVNLLMPGLGVTRAWRVNTGLVAVELVGLACLAREATPMFVGRS